MKIHPLRYERERRGWSRAKVAQELGTKPRTIQRWEEGLVVPFPYYREKLCVLFGKNVRELGLLPGRYTASTEQNSSSTSLSSSPETSEPLYDPLMPMILTGARGLIGRNHLLAQLKQRVCAGENLALTALNGLPGIGKTALAVALTADPEVQTRFRDGILWAGLGINPNVLGLLSRWGTLLGISSTDVDEDNGLRSWQMALRSAIGNRSLLLVVDDAWTAQEALAFQVGGPNCACLVTTRNPQIAFACAEERVLQVPELDEADGVSLLARFAPQVVADNFDTACELVRLVGALPLALMLMGKYLGAQASSGQPRRIQAAIAQLREVEQRLRVSIPISSLDQSPSLSPDVSLSLYAAIAVSDQHLSKQACEALRALSIFPAKPSSFSEEAAQAVAGDSVEVLDELSDAGLLESHSPGRYTLHQTIADYGRSHLQDLEAFQRLVDYYVGYVRTHEADTVALEQESCNIRIALQEAVARKQLGSMQLLHAPASSLHIQGSQGSDPSSQSPQPTNTEERDPLGMAMAVLYLGQQAELRGQYKQAEGYLHQALELARRLDNQELIGYSYGVFAMVNRDCGDYQQAEQYLEECLILVQQLGHEEGTSATHALRCLMAQEQGNYSRAMTEGLEGVRVARQSNHPKISSMPLLFLGLAKFEKGEDQEACNYYLEGLQHARSIDYTSQITIALTFLSLQAYTVGDYQQAELYIQEGLPLARQIEYREYLGLLLRTLGLVALAQGDLQQAKIALQEGLDLARELDHPLLISRLLIGWGMLYLDQGLFEASEQALREAHETVPKEVQAVQAICQYHLARVAAAKGDLPEARALLSSSLAILETIGHRDANTVKKALQEWV